MTSRTGTTTSEPGTTTPVTSSSVPSTITVTAEQNMTSVGTTPTSSTFMTSSLTMNTTMSDNQTSSTTVTTMAYGNDSSTMMTSTSETVMYNASELVCYVPITVYQSFREMRIFEPLLPSFQPRYAERVLWQMRTAKAQIRLRMYHQVILMLPTNFQINWPFGSGK